VLDERGHFYPPSSRWTSAYASYCKKTSVQTGNIPLDDTSNYNMIIMIVTYLLYCYCTYSKRLNFPLNTRAESTPVVIATAAATVAFSNWLYLNYIIPWSYIIMYTPAALTRTRGEVGFFTQHHTRLAPIRHHTIIVS